MTTCATLDAHRPCAELGDQDAQVILAVVLVGERVVAGTPGGRTRWWAAVTIAGAASASVCLVTGSGRAPADFLTYRYAAALAARGVDVYAANVSGPGLAGQPFTYTPVASVVLWPTTVLPSHAGYVVWTVVSLVALAAVLSIGTAVGSVRGTVALAGVLLVAGTTDLVTAHVHVGQVNLLLMGLCLGDLVRADRSRFGRPCPRGVLVGVAAAIKLTPALFVVHFALTRQWRLAGFAVVGFVAATAVGALTRPAMTVTFVRSVFWTLPGRVDLTHAPSFPGNQSVDGMLAAAGLARGPVTAVLVLAVAAGVLAAAGYVRAAGRDLDAWLIVGLGAPMVSPFSWNHHHVFVLPAVLLLARRSWPSRPAATAIAALGALTLLRFDPASGDRWLHSGPWWTAAPGALVRENALLAAAACVLALTWSARRAVNR